MSAICNMQYGSHYKKIDFSMYYYYKQITCK